MAPEFSEEDFKHWFTPREGIVDSYVVEKDGVITDFGSFYHLPSSIMQHPQYKKLNAGSLLSTHTLPSFNPALAPKEVLEAVFPGDLSQQILAQQQEGNFDEDAWRKIVGSREYEFVDIHPRSIFSVEITSTVNQVKLTEGFDIMVQTQKARDPIVFLAKY